MLVAKPICIVVLIAVQSFVKYADLHT